MKVLVLTVFSLCPTAHQSGKNSSHQCLTKRVCPAAVTTPNHLVVAGGRSSAGGDELHTVQSLRQDTGSPLKYIEFYLQPRLGLRHLYGS